MGRPRKGSIEPHGPHTVRTVVGADGKAHREVRLGPGAHWDVRVLMRDNKRGKRLCLDPDVNEADAREIALEISTLAARGEIVSVNRVSKKDSVLAWFERWFADRTSRGNVDAEREHGRFKKWIGELGNKRMTEVTEGDLEDFVEMLDRAAIAHAEAEMEGEKVDHSTMMSWKSAINVWGIVRKGFTDAHKSKTRALRVLSNNPAKDVTGPDEGASKARSSLSPTKFLAFVERDDVPVLWRRVVALAVYTYTRASELRGLRWSDVRFNDGVMVVHRTVNHRGKRGTTKTQKTRLVPIEPELMPLLRALAKGRGPDDVVIEIPDGRHLARALRTWLEFAGLGGPELERSATEAALTWHDLRGTGATWRAIRGDEPLRIMSDAGHDDFKTTLKYIRLADLLRAGYGQVFPPLPASLIVPKIPPESGGSGPTSLRNHWRKYGGGGGNRTQRDPSFPGKQGRSDDSKPEDAVHIPAESDVPGRNLRVLPMAGDPSLARRLRPRLVALLAELDEPDDPLPRLEIAMADRRRRGAAS